MLAITTRCCASLAHHSQCLREAHTSYKAAVCALPAPHRRREGVTPSTQLSLGQLAMPPVKRSSGLADLIAGGGLMGKREAAQPPPVTTTTAPAFPAARPTRPLTGRALERGENRMPSAGGDATAGKPPPRARPQSARAATRMEPEELAVAPVTTQAWSSEVSQQPHRTAGGAYTSGQLGDGQVHRPGSGCIDRVHAAGESVEPWWEQEQGGVHRRPSAGYWALGGDAGLLEGRRSQQ
jgi:hypothetical protein